MRGDLFSYLVDGLSGDERVSQHAVGRVQHHAVALVQGDLFPTHVHEDWPGFFSVVEAFVLACGSPWLRELARRSSLFVGDGNGALTEDDRAFLVALVAEMDERGSPGEA